MLTILYRIAYCPVHGQVTVPRGDDYCNLIVHSGSYCSTCGGADGVHRQRGCTGQFEATFRPCSKQLTFSSPGSEQ